jgi:cyclophilin family peptidyl-prolyl cis-trans isomerase
MGKHLDPEPPLPDNDGRRKAVVFGLSAALGLLIAVMLYLTMTPAGPGSGSSESVDSTKPRVKLVTTLGDIVLELEPRRAPITVENFLKYVDDGFYADTLFHRVAKDFVIQGGGLDLNGREKPARPPILNEADNGLKNVRGSIAMARTNDPDSATSQFYINLKDSPNLDYGFQQFPGRAPQPGYAVFGRVVSGMDVVDRIGKVKTTGETPVERIVIKSAKRL